MGKQMAHCFRFSVEYLLSIGLLRSVRGAHGAGPELDPNDLAAFVAHLFFMEPSNFAFLTLLAADNGRTLKKLCRPGRANREERVVAILCHLFCRSRLTSATANWANRHRDETGPSTVVLERLSDIGDVEEEEGGRRVRRR